MLVSEELVARVFAAKLEQVATDHALGDLIENTYSRAHQVVMSAARESSHLFTLGPSHNECSAFMFARAHRLGDLGAVYLGPAGAHASQRGRGIQRRLFELFDRFFVADEFPIAWGITASPIMTRAWTSFFPKSWPRRGQPLPSDLVSLAANCWAELGKDCDRDAPMVVRGQFRLTHAYTAEELRRLGSARSPDALVPDVDPAAGDRMLLLASRSGEN